jgi:hypothetical protein
MAVVRSVQHVTFAEENGMSSFLMSAKNGDQVKHAFWKLASTLAGIPFQRFEQDGNTVPIKATIVDYARSATSIICTSIWLILILSSL